MTDIAIFVIIFICFTVKSIHIPVAFDNLLCIYGTYDIVKVFLKLFVLKHNHHSISSLMAVMDAFLVFCEYRVHISFVFISST